MKEPLLSEPRGRDDGARPSWPVVAEEMVSIVMVGHRGELALSSTAIAVSLAGVSGFSLLMGMSTALETLCGQACGAN
ncbi:hypothetical protein MLD38_003897 [Melastoma candidum]|uniref:Uncharacterized protein n=1 Tax=Melastoma candidum TaxID=119954 RepID=A0ACB9S7V1_9MYRT|nr:hypothetical protein MLD38_003897 [Melastoma candidum]